MHSGGLGRPVVPASRSCVAGQRLPSAYYMSSEECRTTSTKRTDVLERSTGALSGGAVLRVGCSASTLSDGLGRSRLVLCWSGLLVTGTV